MNKKVLITLTIIFSSFASMIYAQNKATDPTIVYYEYKVMGETADPNMHFKVEAKNAKKCLVTIYNVEKRKYCKFKVEPQLIDRITKIAQEYRMDAYQKHYTPLGFDVCDGTSWTYSAKYSNGKTLSSNGENAGPNDGAFKEIIRQVKNATCCNFDW